MSAPGVDRLHPPVAALPRLYRFPELADTRLENGLRVLAVRVEPVPLVSLELVLGAGAQHDPPGRAGLASLHAGLLDEGTAAKSALEIATAIERLGGSLASGADWDATYLSAGVLSAHLEEALGLVAELATEPSFPPDEIERLRQQRLADILRQGDQPSIVAHRTFLRALYRETVYGQLHTGSEDGVGAIDRGDLLGYYQRCVTPSSATLVAAGELDPEAFVARAEAMLGTWAPRPAAIDPTITPPAITTTEVHLVDRPGSSQTQLELGHAGPPRNHPDRHALSVLNAIFGGKFTSRINLVLRERHGFTYNVRSQFVGRRGPGPWLVQTAVANESAGAAVTEILRELRRIVAEPVTDEELVETRQYLVGVFPYTVQTTGEVAGRLEDLAVYDLPADYYDDYPAVLGRITRDEVHAAAQRHLDPEHLVIVAVGPADELHAQLEPFGPITVYEA